MTKGAGLDQLSVINQKVVGEGEVLPQVVLKDGSQVQTGTVATMLHNIELYNAGQRGQIEEELKAASQAGIERTFRQRHRALCHHPERCIAGLPNWSAIYLIAGATGRQNQE